jgi:hypothetical protein
MLGSKRENSNIILKRVAEFQFHLREQIDEWLTNSQVKQGIDKLAGAIREIFQSPPNILEHVEFGAAKVKSESVEAWFELDRTNRRSLMAAEVREEPTAGLLEERIFLHSAHHFKDFKEDSLLEKLVTKLHGITCDV